MGQRDYCPVYGCNNNRERREQASMKLFILPWYVTKLRYVRSLKNGWNNWNKESMIQAVDLFKPKNVFLRLRLLPCWLVNSALSAVT